MTKLLRQVVAILGTDSHSVSFATAFDTESVISFSCHTFHLVKKTQPFPSCLSRSLTETFQCPKLNLPLHKLNIDQGLLFFWASSFYLSIPTPN